MEKKNCVVCGSKNLKQQKRGHRLYIFRYCSQCHWKIQKSTPGYLIWNERRKIRAKLWVRTPPGIYSALVRHNSKEYRKKIQISKNEFISWYKEQIKRCSYCGTLNNLTVDRMDNDGTYNLNNIVLACRKCNFIKSNVFSFNEMSEIGNKYLRNKKNYG